MVKRFTPYFFLFPAFLIFFVFIFIPSIEILRMSFYRVSFVTESRWVGFENYVRIWSDETFRAALLNSLVYLATTPILIVLSLGTAFLLDTGIRGAKFFRAVYFLPAVTPMIVVGIMWKWILNEDVGLLNSLTLSLGIAAERIPWLSAFPLNLFAVMAVTVWKGIGYYAIIFLAGLLAIPKEMEEAAMLDGASAFQRMRFIKIPMLKPTIALVAIISAVAALKVFDELYVIIPGSPQSEQTLVPLLYQTAFMDFRLGLASAMGVVLFLLVMGFSYFNVRLWKET
jgi:putative chitobiose transport system permease protein